MGVRVPSVKIGGYIMPIGDLKVKGTIIPKNNQNKVGQNANENIKPIINDGLNILNLRVKFSTLAINKFPIDPFRFRTPNI